MTPNPKDWALFKALVPGWQEAYMNRLNQQYTAILTSDRSPDDKFWALEKRIRKDKKSPGVILEMTRSKMEWNLISLIYDGVISLEDLTDFSDELKERITIITNHA